MRRPPLLDRDNLVGDNLHKVAKDDREHRHADKQGDKDGEDFRNEDEGHFLNLRQRLQKRNSNTDDQTHNHDGRTQLDAEPDGFTDKIYDFVIIHDVSVCANRAACKP